MSLPTLAALLLHLYPPSFRRRFTPEWTEIVDWHRRSLAGARFAGVRLAWILIVDALRALPAAYGSILRECGTGQPPDSLARDVRHGLRGLLRNPAFTVAAVLSVALGIGANTAVFSVANAVLLRPLPYRAAERLTIVWNEFPGSGMARLPMSGPELESLREEPDLFEDVAGVWATSGTVTDAEGGVHQVSVGAITPNFFTLLGVEPALGRGFVRGGSEGPVPAGVLVSHEVWTSRFGADPDLVGAPIQLNGQPVDVIGVLPEGFALFFPEDGAIPPYLDIYRPLPWDAGLLPPAQHFLRVIGRLRPGVDLTRASAGVASAAERARTTYAELQSTGDRFSVHPLQEDSVRAARPVLVALLAAVGLFLLLASANVASLLLARTMARGRELAIRASIGASPLGLVRLLTVESLLVAVSGAMLGVWFGRVGATTLWALRPSGLARADHVPLDGRVLAFTAALSVGAALVFALISLWAVRSLDPGLGLRSGGPMAGRSGRRARELVTAAEVAIGLVLVAGSALMIQSVSSLGRESVGFDPDRALTFKIALSERRFPTNEERAGLARDLERRLREVPGVRAAGAISHLPFATWANWAEAAPPEGTPESERAGYFADLRAVTPAYLQAIGAELVAGRFFGEHDDADGEPVVIIDQAMAERVFPGEQAVGRTIEPSRYTNGEFVVTAARVVGVIRDIRDRSPSRPSEGQVFWPFGQSPRWELTYFVRAEGDPTALADAIHREVRAVSPDLAAAGVTVMDEYVQVATGLTRFLALVASVFAALALVMASIGLYGVVAFVTVQRTHEFGMRAVLGATRRELLRGVLRHGLRIGTLGVGMGLVATLGLTRFLGGLVYGVSPHDPLTLAAVGGLLLAVAVLASLAPAWRATRVDPLVALRDS